jgi:hypothetical protein
MLVHPVIFLVCIYLLWLGCSDKSTTPDGKKGLSKVEIDSLSKASKIGFTGKNKYEFATIYRWNGLWPFVQPSNTTGTHRRGQCYL